MSKRFNLGENTWQTYELYGKAPKGETLAALAELGFDINWLLTGQGSMTISGDGPRMPLPHIDDRLVGEAVEFVEQWLAEHDTKFDAPLKGNLVAAICRLAVEEADNERPRINPAAGRQMMWLARQINN
ncbi:hypothetical protein ABNQ39_36255 (plasmid) [Azospirillum sp. A26]|uniref:hypothetical protein n=1 Tax=Azospirillum sp. A26 TaxID=3160607 RepID=UPI003670968B